MTVRCPSRPGGSRTPATCIADPTVVAMPQLAVVMAATERHHQGVDHQVGGLVDPHRPANNRLIMQVLDAGKEQLPIPTGELGDVRHPSAVRRFGGEIPLQQIRRRCGVRPASAPSTATVHPNQTVDSHQPGDPLPTHPPSPVPQLAADPWRTLGALERPMNVDDRLSQDLVVEVTARRCPVAPRIEARTRNIDEDTEPGDRILAGILGDEPSAHLLVSRAKHAAAFRRISRFIRNSRFSLRSRSNSVRPSTSRPDSASRRACFTQVASDPSAIPSDRATSALGRSDDRYNSTASRRNSSGYLDDRPIPGLLPLRLTPGSGVQETGSPPSRRATYGPSLVELMGAGLCSRQGLGGTIIRGSPKVERARQTGVPPDHVPQAALAQSPAFRSRPVRADPRHRLRVGVGARRHTSRGLAADLVCSSSYAGPAHMMDFMLQAPVRPPSLRRRTSEGR